MEQMPTVAEQLRAGREVQKLTLNEVAEKTKIRADRLLALEEGNFGVFSAPIYICGSVKNYATLLKLDVPQIMAALDAELKGTEKFSEPPPFTDESDKPLNQAMFLLAKLNWKMALAAAGVVVVVLILLLVNLVLKHNQNRDPLAGLPPAVYQPANSGDTLPLSHH
jgi:cytoskeletal protein RodZ